MHSNMIDGQAMALARPIVARNIPGNASLIEVLCLPRPCHIPQDGEISVLSAVSLNDLAHLEHAL